MAKVAVVILNYNGEKHLKQFLPSVLEHSGSAAIWVADNASTDSSVSFVKENYPTVKVLEMQVNTGYAGGYKEALSKISAEYFVLLNSDVEVTNGWVDPIIKLMDEDTSIAACQPKIKSFLEKDKFEYAGAAGGFVDKYGYPFCRGRIFESLELDTGQYDKVSDVFWATGACLFVRAASYNEVGGLDADYFAHMEEIDLCWRLKNSGYKIKCEPSSIVYHLGGGTLQKSSPQKTYLNFRNSLFTLLKNHPEKGLFSKIMVRLILDGVAGVKFMLEGGMSHAIAIIKAHFSFYTKYGRMKKKRVGNETAFNNYYNGSIVFVHYLSQINQFSKLPNKWK